MNHDGLPITAAEAAPILGVSARTVIRWAEDPGCALRYLRKLPGPNGDYLFERAEVLRHRDDRAARSAS